MMMQLVARVVFLVTFGANVSSEYGHRSMLERPGPCNPSELTVPVLFPGVIISRYSLYHHRIDQVHHAIGYLSLTRKYTCISD